MAGSDQVGTESTDFEWLSASNPNLPWYAPKPEGPTPAQWKHTRLTRMCTPEHNSQFI